MTDDETCTEEASSLIYCARYSEMCDCPVGETIYYGASTDDNANPRVLDITKDYKQIISGTSGYAVHNSGSTGCVKNIFGNLNGNIFCWCDSAANSRYTEASLTVDIYECPTVSIVSSSTPHLKVYKRYNSESTFDFSVTDFVKTTSNPNSFAPVEIDKASASDVIFYLNISQDTFTTYTSSGRLSNFIFPEDYYDSYFKGSGEQLLKLKTNDETRISSSVGTKETIE